MKKGRFFRRINRGLLLGGGILVAVILYTIISNAVFQATEISAIRKLTENYLTDYASFTTNFEAEKVGHTLTSDEVDKRMAAFADFTARYFVGGYTRMGGDADKRIENIREDYRTFLTKRTCLYKMQSLAFDLGEHANIRIEKQGPRNARVTLSLSGRTSFYGMADILYVPGAYVYSYEDTDFGYDEPFYDSEKTYDTELHDGRCTLDGTLYLEKQGGEWRIVNVPYMYAGMHMEGGK